MALHIISGYSDSCLCLFIRDLLVALLLLYVSATRTSQTSRAASIRSFLRAYILALITHPSCLTLNYSWMANLAASSLNTMPLLCASSKLLTRFLSLSTDLQNILSRHDVDGFMQLFHHLHNATFRWSSRVLSDS